jgi:hypothetical protein
MTSPVTITYKTSTKQACDVEPGDRFMLADSFIVLVQSVPPHGNFERVTLNCQPETFNLADDSITFILPIQLVLDANYMLGIIQD